MLLKIIIALIQHCLYFLFVKAEIYSTIGMSNPKFTNAFFEPKFLSIIGLATLRFVDNPLKNVNPTPVPNTAYGLN